MKLTINLYNVLPAPTNCFAQEIFTRYSDDIRCILKKKYPTRLTLEIIYEQAHAEWVWLVLTEEGKENPQDADVLTWLKEELPGLVDFHGGLPVKPHRFQGEMGKWETC